MEFLVNGALTEPCVNTFQSKESSVQQNSTDAQENEVVAARKMSLLAGLLSLPRSTFSLWSSASGELES